jgi:hypothetical protein
MRINTIFLILFITITACAQKNKHFEGTLLYVTNDRIQLESGVDSAQYIKYFVQGDLIRVENKTQMGDQIYIKDLSKNSAVLLFNFGSDKFALTQDLTMDTISKNYTTKKDCKNAQVGDFKAKCLSISGEHLKEPVRIYYTKSHPGYMVDIYDGITPGLPLQYDLIVQGEKVGYELVKLEEKEVPTSLFEIPDGYLRMTMDEFLQRLSPEQ